MHFGAAERSQRIRTFDAQARGPFGLEFVLVLFALCAGVAAGSTSATAAPLVPGDIVVSGTSGLGVGSGLIRIDPMTGAQELISAGNFGDFTLVDGRAYAISGDSIIEVDLSNGGQRTVTTGGNMTRPHAITADRSGTLFAYGVVDSSRVGSLVAIDSMSGDQSVIASGYANPQLLIDLELSKNGNPLLLKADPDYRWGVAEVLEIPETGPVPLAPLLDIAKSYRV